jgi:hypothetical protein
MYKKDKDEKKRKKSNVPDPNDMKKYMMAFYEQMKFYYPQNLFMPNPVTPMNHVNPMMPYQMQNMPGMYMPGYNK